MSDSISVRITLDSYDLLRPREKQTQVYVQIPEVARVSYMLPAERFQGLKDRAWPEVLDVAHEHYERGWAVEDPATVAARAAVRAWLRDDANHDEMQAAFEEDHARRDPVARKLLEENERLRSKVAELDKISDEALAERDGMHDALDEFAQAVAPEEVIGEHSSGNNPWANALNLLTPVAEVDKLRARVAELEADLAAKAQDTEAAVKGWGRARDRVAVLKAAQAPAKEYGPAFPWVALMDDDDRSEFLGELAAAAINYYRPEAGDEATLAEIEKACMTWRLIAEAQHAHNTAPGSAASGGGE
ncbi:hypothetical protein CU044_2139 [Streptomyces sp. L-9-10]|uniref:hypothetical protein n=1 Tax=Streptomyces sp. L-9-10 TaxID=1478131 RepID=UPI00101DE4EE|nr:hypothetical protein [Streptomyces sp. L-9-10]RYJ29398.1 hypothetical protein CU044_2139 [Streptomyces sp. L-9-10]